MHCEVQLLFRGGFGTQGKHSVTPCESNKPFPCYRIRRSVASDEGRGKSFYKFGEVNSPLCARVHGIDSRFEPKIHIPNMYVIILFLITAQNLDQKSSIHKNFKE